MRVSECVCVCVRERERVRKREKEGERERERERERSTIRDLVPERRLGGLHGLSRLRTRRSVTICTVVLVKQVN